MSKSAVFAEELLLKVFNNVEFSWLPLNKFYIALHTGDAGKEGNQGTNECAYTNYKRQAMYRTNDTDWLISGGTVKNKTQIVFPTCTGGNETATYFSIGTTESEIGAIIYSGVLKTSIPISLNIRPQFGIGAIVILEN